MCKINYNLHVICKKEMLESNKIGREYVEENRGREGSSENVEEEAVFGEVIGQSVRRAERIKEYLKLFSGAIEI
jgi:hypothetical protein